MRLKSVSSLLIVTLFGCVGDANIAPAHAQHQKDITGVTQILIRLVDQQDKTRIDPDDYTSTSLDQLRRLVTPAGYRLKVRYLEFGVSLVEALRIARDVDLKRRLVEEAQWARRKQTRAEALISLASYYDPSHKRYFRSAIMDKELDIRFAAVEALQVWGYPEGTKMIEEAMGRDASQLMRLFCAQALLALGKKNVISVLWEGMESNSWVVRALSARYLGDYATPEDYTRIIKYLNREKKSDRVVAELCLAALKLISQKGEKVSYSPLSPGWKENEEVKYYIGKDDVIELEPFIIVPPQLKIPPSLREAARINTELLDLIKNRLNKPMSSLDEQDPVWTQLQALRTPTGFALYQRYSKLGYIVIEGTAGTRDPILRAELQRLASGHPDPDVQASAIVALSYNRDQSDLYILNDGLRSSNEIVRFGAMEAVEVGRFRSALPALAGIVNSDPSEALRVYGMQIQAKFGDSSGRLLMFNYMNSRDWPARAMAFQYLSRYGKPEDYTMVLSRLPSERNPWVQAEIALAILRLSPL